MNSKRKFTQAYLEEYFGCFENPSKWTNTTITELKLDSTTKNDLIVHAQYDAKSYFFNGLVTFVQAIKGLKNEQYTWSTIQFYYCIYYFLRSSLYIQNIVLVRNRSLFKLELKLGESPNKKNNKKYNSDHSGTINHYIDLYDDSDILLSNKINGTHTYLWLMEKREFVNYRIGRFRDPKYYEFTKYYFTNKFQENFIDIIQQEIDDEYIRCFQPETALLSISVKRLMQTYKTLHNTLPLKSILTAQQYLFIKKHLKSERLITDLLQVKD